MAPEDLHPSPVLQATLMPTLAPHTLQLYGPGGPPGLPSPPKQPQWPRYPLNCHNFMTLEDLQPSPVLQATLLPTLAPHTLQLYGPGSPRGLPSPPNNPCGHSIPSTATTLWLWRTSRPSQPSQQPLCPLYPHISPNFMTLEDLQASPVLQATLMPTLAPYTLELYGSGGLPGTGR